MSASDDETADGHPRRASGETPLDSDAIDATAAWLTDLLYTGVGLGILAINRIQVARRSAERELENRGFDVSANPGLAAISDLLGEPERLSAIAEKLRCEVQDLDERLDGIEDHVLGVLGRIEPDLPEAARDLSAAVRRLASDHAPQLRAMLGLDPR